MKVRKILPLLILAVGAVALLSSCNVLLDAIYPPNAISLDVAVNVSNHTDYLISSVNAQLHDNSYSNLLVSSVNAASPRYEGWSRSGYVHYYFTFARLNNDTYTVTAAYNSSAGTATPATNYIPTNNFTFPYSNSGGSGGHSISMRAYVP
jgi:hypothetical protein